MPLYEYECEACGHRLERIQKYSDPPLEDCPSCGKKALRKLLSSPAIQFKGSGFYITDYARKGNAGTAGTQSTKNKTEKTSSESAASAPASGETSSGSSDTASASSTTSSSSSSKGS